MEPERDVCIGCCRTLEEIALWSRMSDDQREAVMRELPARRNKLSLPPATSRDDRNGA
jgi:uncharacterized protein